MRAVGEIDYVAEATASFQNGMPQVAKGIVGYADLRRGAAVRDVLEAELEASYGRLRGVRHLVAWDPADTA